MKKISLLLLSISLSSAAEIYCPSAITCATADDVDACMFEQYLQGYWEWVPSSAPRDPLIGQYHLTYVSAPDASDVSGYAICVYTHEKVYQTLSLRARAGFDLVATHSPTSQWRAEETWWECKPDSLSSCPMMLFL